MKGCVCARVWCLKCGCMCLFLLCLFSFFFFVPVLSVMVFVLVDNGRWRLTACMPFCIFQRRDWIASTATTTMMAMAMAMTMVMVMVTFLRSSSRWNQWSGSGEGCGVSWHSSGCSESSASSTRSSYLHGEPSPTIELPPLPPTTTNTNTTTNKNTTQQHRTNYQQHYRQHRHVNKKPATVVLSWWGRLAVE